MQNNKALDQRTDRFDLQECERPTRWDDFLLENDGPVFATWEWMQACEAYGHEAIPLAVTSGSALIGALPLVHIRSRLFGNKLVSMPFAEYGSVLTRSNTDMKRAIQQRLLAETRQLADQRNVDFVSLRGRELGTHEHWENKQRWVTFEIPTGEGTEALWDSLDSSRRGHIRQARENDLTHRVGETVEDLEKFYGLYLQTMRGHGSPALPFGFFERLWESFHGAGHMRLSLVEYEGTPINSVIDFPFGSQVYHWKAVSNYEYRDLDGGSLLLWNAIEWAAKEGYDIYNLGRTREGSGVYMYKKSFGGKKVWLSDYHYWPDSKAELPHPETDSYELAKRVWRRLPLRLTRLLGPPIRKNISL